MNHTPQEAAVFCEEFLRLYRPTDSAVVGFAPAAPCISSVTQSLPTNSGILVGAQNVHWLESGAHTGEVSPAMLIELGVKFCIVGHSERRQFYGETSENVSRRARAAIESGMQAVVCIGETQEQFQADATEAVVREQLHSSLAEVPSGENLLVAYEPAWAIGTGLAATPEIIAGVHRQIRELLDERFGGHKVPILYGGSTKPDNITEICSVPDVAGALVGGASLEAESFNSLVVNGCKAG